MKMIEAVGTIGCTVSPSHSRISISVTWKVGRMKIRITGIASPKPNLLAGSEAKRSASAVQDVRCCDKVQEGAT